MRYPAPPPAPNLCTIPCRCLYWRHDQSRTIDRRHTTIQTVPWCPQHGESFDTKPAARDWLFRELAIVRVHAHRSPRPWQDVLRARLEALWLPDLTTEGTPA